MNRNVSAMKTLALIGAALAYAGAVIYGDVMFLQTVHVAFPESGIFGSLSVAGALVTALSALILPVALHYWFAPGMQFVWGVIFWFVDIAALALNAMLAYQAAVGQGFDPFIQTWRTWSPATPMLAVIGWGLAFLLDPSHKLRHAQAELEADQIDIYAARLRGAAKSEEVTGEINEAARVAAWDFASKLNAGTNRTGSARRLPAPGTNGQKPQMAMLNSDGEDAQAVSTRKARRRKSADPNG